MNLFDFVDVLVIPIVITWVLVWIWLAWRQRKNNDKGGNT
jgi:hypothetical protein